MRHKPHIQPRWLVAVSVPAVALASVSGACRTEPVAPARPGEPSAARPASSSPTPDILEMTIPQLQAAMDAGQLTARALVLRYLDRIRAYDRAGPALNAVVALNPDALADAEALDRERAERGPRGPLHGIPVVIKDNFDVARMATTGGVAALAGHIPPDDAYQVRKLREAGAIILAKTNMHELAFGITTVSSVAGPTRNPYDPARNPGGSSGGTGAAVAANFAAGGFGSDTCGSIRIPASHNNLVGLRATHGASSLDGILPLAATMDVGGPLARTIVDLATLLDATTGDPDGRVALAYPDGASSFVASLDGATLRGARIGALTALFSEGREDDAVAAVVREALREMAGLGAEIVDVEIPGLSEVFHGGDALVVIDHEYRGDLAASFAASGAPVKSLQDVRDTGLYHEILASTLARGDTIGGTDAPEYAATTRRRAELRQRLISFMDEQRLDVLAYPTIRRRPTHIGERQYGSNCALSSLSGFPALTIPAGFTDDGLPAGIELLGRPLTDPSLLALGHAYEQAARHRQPPDTTPALRDGAAPAPLATALAIPAGQGEVRVELELDGPRRELRYRLAVSGMAAADVLFVGLRRGRAGSRGPVVIPLPRGQAQASGALPLSARDSRDLRQGALYLSVSTRAQPHGSLDAQLQW